MAKNRPAIQWVRTSDAIHNFVTEHADASPRRALLCTYDFDVERFEAVLFPELTRRGRQFRTLILADAAALQTGLTGAVQRFARYSVAPVRCPKGGVFHPKLVFLSAGKRRLVGIGSANLTAGGLGSNLELMLWADDTTDYGRQLAAGAGAFLRRLTGSRSAMIPSSARDFIETILAGVGMQRNVIIDSLDQQLLTQIARAVRTTHSSAQGISILSPWHSAVRSPDGLDPAVLGELRLTLGSNITVFTNGEKGRGPDLGVPVHIRSDKGVAQGDDEAGEVDGDAPYDNHPQNVHAKAYLVKSKLGGTLFFGSANCTAPALLRSAVHGGNIELLVGSRLGHNEVAAFERSLGEMFAPAMQMFNIKLPVRPPHARGTILCGCVNGGRNGPRLRLECPGIARGSARIGRAAEQCAIRVRIYNGIGTVSDATTLKALFPGAAPSQAEAFWGSVLWEKVAAGAVPFPVSIPLLAEETGQADEFFEALALEEMGVWPARNGNSAERTEDKDDSDEDGDLDSLAESMHQGELDRLAISVAIVRKRLRHAAAGKEYARVRLKYILQKLNSMDLSPHIRKVLVGFLTRSGRKNGGTEQ